MTEVCALERHWVLSPRALGYWIPVVEMFRACLEQACCGPYEGGGGRTSPPAFEGTSPLECMDRSLEGAMATVRNAFATMGKAVGPMGDLHAAMGSAGATSVATAVASGTTRRRRRRRQPRPSRPKRPRRSVRSRRRSPRSPSASTSSLPHPRPRMRPQGLEAMSPVRPVFSDGAILGAADLTALGQLDRDRDARHARHLHTPGVAAGLELTDARAGQRRRRRRYVDVTLQPGYAIDGTGRELVVATALPVSRRSVQRRHPEPGRTKP